MRLLKNIFTKVWKMKFSNVHLLALVLHDLSRFHPEFTVLVVDQVLEDARSGMEQNIFKCNQQRVAGMRYLGELYSYRVVDSKVILDTLWSLVTFGHRASPFSKGFRRVGADEPKQPRDGHGLTWCALSTHRTTTSAHAWSALF